MCFIDVYDVPLSAFLALQDSKNRVPIMILAVFNNKRINIFFDYLFVGFHANWFLYLLENVAVLAMVAPVHVHYESQLECSVVVCEARV